MLGIVSQRQESNEDILVLYIYFLPITSYVPTSISQNLALQEPSFPTTH